MKNLLRQTSPRMKTTVGGKGRHLQYCALFLHYNERLKRCSIFQCQSLLSLGFPTSSLLYLKITLSLYKRSHEYFPKFLNYLAIKKKKNPELSQFCRTSKSVAHTQRKCTFKTSVSVGQAEKARLQLLGTDWYYNEGSSGQRTHTDDSTSALKPKHQGILPACLSIIPLITL